MTSTERTVSVRVHMRVPRRWVDKDHLWGLNGVLRSMHVDGVKSVAKEDTKQRQGDRRSVAHPKQSPKRAPATSKRSPQQRATPAAGAM